MKPHLEGNLLDNLGVVRAQLGAATEVRLKSDDVGEGLVREALALAALISHPEAGAFEPVEVASASAVGVQVEVSARDAEWIRMLFPKGVAVGVEVSKGDRDRDFALFEGARPTLLLNPEAAGVTYAHRDDGEGLLAVPTPGGVVLIAVNALGAIGIMGPGLRDAPIATWTESTTDPWMALELAERQTPGSAWSQVVAAGLYVRLLEPPLAVIRETVTAMAEGRPSPGRAELGAPVLWFAELSAMELDEVERLALSEVDLALAILDRLLATSDADIQQEEFAELCRSRDDLEGVLVLLETRARGHGIREALRAVDEVAEELRDEGLSPPLDERFRRVGRWSEDAWWALAEGEGA